MAFGDILNTPATDSASSNFANTITVTLAATPVSGNAIVACYSTAATTATADDMKPTGFTVASEATNTAINRKAVQYLKISDGTETAVTCGGGDAYAGEVVVYVVDVDGNATPLGDVGSNNPSTGDDTNPIACGSVTTTVADSVVIASATHTLGSGGVATPSTGFTLGSTVQGSGSGQATIHKLLSATGTESPTVSMAGGVSDNAGCSLSLYATAAVPQDPEQETTGNIPLTPAAGWTSYGLVDPVFTLTSALRGYTGGAAVTGDALEVGPITGLGAGMSISFLSDGRYNINDPNDTWVGDITFPRRVIRADGTIGFTQVMTIDADVVNNEATGIPTITGTAQEGSTLTAVTTGIADLDGIASFLYQWYRGVAVISGATNPTYTPANGDIGSTIHVDVSPVDNNGTVEGPLSSANTAIVTAADGTPPTMPADASVNVTEGVTAVGTYAATAGDAPITYTLSGTDAADFSVDENTGAVTFDNAPDYEAQTVHYFTVTATNTTDSASQNITVNITDVDEVSPTVQILGAPAEVNDATPFTVTVQFSETVTGFAVGDITVANASLSNFSATDGDTYTVDVTPDLGGTVTLDVAADVAQDGAANGNTAATQVSIAYVVLNTNAPVISLLGATEVDVSEGDAYVDAGATATDVEDGNLTGDIVTINPVDVDVPGTYIVRYRVTDSGGLQAVEVTRIVRVNEGPATLSSPVVLGVSPFSATVSVTTDKTTGTVFALPSAAAVEDEAAIKGGTGVDVTEAGTLVIPVGGMAQTSSYYVHFIHDNGADSNIVVTAQFQTGTYVPAPEGDDGILRGVLTSPIKSVLKSPIN